MAFVGHHSALAPINDRRTSFLDAVARYSPKVKAQTVADLDSLEGGRQAARELLSSGFKPTAIVCVNDFMALGVLRELREAGLRVPKDVSVTGFDNITLSEFCYPALTTAHIPRDRIGHIAFESLALEGDNAQPSGREIVINPEFVVRDSTGPAPNG